MKYVYGPVPSRRLGKSLGVSPIPPKTCSYTCIYCQLGHTTRLQTNRESFFPKEEILSEIVAHAQRTKPEYITFVGDGEPTLSRDLGWLIERSKAETNLPIAVITNGSLLSREDVRKDLMGADVVMPTLDAGDEETFRNINRPHRSIDFRSMLDGQIKFSKDFPGQIWLEVMLVKGVNDSNEQLKAIREVVHKINPDRVYVMVPTRPPAEKWVEPPDPERIVTAQHLFGRAVGIATPERGTFGVNGFADAREALLEIGSRHPLRREQAEGIEQTMSAPGTVARMVAQGELVEVHYNNSTYLLPRHLVRGKGELEYL